MSRPAAETTLLLARIREDDREALDDLMRTYLPRIERWVRNKRGALIKSREETLDSAQDVAMSLFRYLPKVKISDSKALERLLSRMIQNSLSSRSDYLLAQRRNLAREQPLSGGSEIDLDPLDPKAATPSVAAVSAEREAWIRFALALMEPDEQELIIRRFYRDEAFPTIGDAFEITDDAARLRCSRALAKLGTIAKRLREGSAADVAAELNEE